MFPPAPTCRPRSASAPARAPPRILRCASRSLSDSAGSATASDRRHRQLADDADQQAQGAVLRMADHALVEFVDGTDRGGVIARLCGGAADPPRIRPDRRALSDRAFGQQRRQGGLQQHAHFVNLTERRAVRRQIQPRRTAPPCWCSGTAPWRRRAPRPSAIEIFRLEHPQRFAKMGGDAELANQLRFRRQGVTLAQLAAGDLLSAAGRR